MKTLTCSIAFVLVGHYQLDYYYVVKDGANVVSGPSASSSFNWVKHDAGGYHTKKDFDQLYPDGWEVKFDFDDDPFLIPSPRTGISWEEAWEEYKQQPKPPTIPGRLPIKIEPHKEVVFVFPMAGVYRLSFGGEERTFTVDRPGQYTLDELLENAEEVN